MEISDVLENHHRLTASAIKSTPQKSLQKIAEQFIMLPLVIHKWI